MNKSRIAVVGCGRGSQQVSLSSFEEMRVISNDVADLLARGNPVLASDAPKPKRTYLQ